MTNLNCIILGSQGPRKKKFPLKSVVLQQIEIELVS